MIFQKPKILLLITTILSLFFVSCGDDAKNENRNDIVVSDSLNTATLKSQETFFQVPSPSEMLNFIKLIGSNNNKNVSFLNSVSNLKSYSDNKSKALNFGVYGCDLSYCSIFDIGGETINYFKTIKQLGDQIGVSSVLKPEILKRLQDNLNNPDSLSIISDDIYFSSFETLEASKQGSTLVLVIVGGWVEGLYIVTNLAKFEENSPIIQRFADQKYTLDNLLEFLRQYENDKNVASVLKQLQELKEEFDQIKEKDAAPVSLKEKNKKIIAGGKDLVLTAEQYNRIVNKIKIIRNSFTLTN
ncbi:MAG: hypothetical protein ACK504_02875 [Bacteroidota bacterium]|jgi:hypothetical protein